jgi:hypothetical protein
MDRQAIKSELTQQFQQSLEEAIDAVERAPDGKWIAASEWQVRAIVQRLMQQSYERLLQARLDAAPAAAFSPSKPVPVTPPTAQQGPPGRRRADGRR